MLVMEQLPSIRKWAECRLDCNFGDQAITIANYQDGKVVAVVVLSNFKKTQCELSIASDSPKWGSRLFIREVFNFAFNYAKLHRVNSLISVSNDKSISLCERLGFIREGKLREAADDGSDLWVYGMLKSECRWVNYGR